MVPEHQIHAGSARWPMSAIGTLPSETSESFAYKPEKGQTRDKGTLGKVSLGSTGQTRAYVGGLLRQMLPPLATPA